MSLTLPARGPTEPAAPSGTDRAPRAARGTTAVRAVLGSYPVRRLVRALTTLLVVLLATFAMTRVAYRNPAATLAPRNADQQVIDGIARSLRLDEPWWDQLWHYLFRGPDIQGAQMGLLHWPPALGYSFRKQTPVTELVLEKVSVTASLALGALVIWMLVSLTTGVLASRRPGGRLDRVLSGFSYVALSVPTFVVAILLSYFLFFKLSTYGIRWFPSSGYVPLGEDPLQWARHLLLPWTAIAVVEIGIFHRVVRGSMLEVLGTDYVRTARAKGVREWWVLLDHGLRAALTPILTLGGLELASVLGGAIVVETMFGLDGVGRLAIESALSGDFPVVIGTTLFASVVFILCTLAVDLVAWLRDPARGVQ